MIVIIWVESHSRSRRTRAKAARLTGSLEEFLSQVSGHSSISSQGGCTYLKSLFLAQGGYIICQLDHALNEVYCEVATVKDESLGRFADSLQKVGIAPPPGHKATGIILTPAHLLY